MEDIEKLRKKIRKEAEQGFEMNGSDIPIHERFVKEESIKRLKKKNERDISGSSNI